MIRAGGIIVKNTLSGNLMRVCNNRCVINISQFLEINF